jgi:hypothetical protein
MIRIELQQREKERFPSWLLAAALGLDRDEDRIEPGDGLGVVELQDQRF